MLLRRASAALQSAGDKSISMLQCVYVCVCVCQEVSREDGERFPKLEISEKPRRPISGFDVTGSYPRFHLCKTYIFPEEWYAQTYFSQPIAASAGSHEFAPPRAPVAPSQRRRDWSGCQEGPVVRFRGMTGACLGPAGSVWARERSRRWHRKRASLGVSNGFWKFLIRTTISNDHTKDFYITPPGQPFI